MSVLRAPHRGDKLVSTLITSMKEDDLPEVLDIERESFPTPWPQSFFRAEMRNPLARSYVLKAHFEDGGKCVGYLCSWFIHNELHILNLAVGSDFRRLGFGLRLLTHVLHLAVETGLTLATLEARPSNTPALNLYRKLGFRAVGVRPNYYYDTREDAVALLLDLPQRTVNP
ncbi:MAG: ribosomal protein S18-alanine N-acetyltransferase [Nitrospirae bacterium]|nr:ribosomal protein S18-alanine N-acetyltransferase [Nitrospirota bacterium]